MGLTLGLRDTRYQMLDTGYRIQDAGYQMPDARSGIKAH